MNDLTNLQSEFSLAYVQAVASAAGFFVQETNRVFDMDGVDVTLMSRGPHGVTRSPRLDVQVKSKRGVFEGDPWVYDLDAKNYNELRDDRYQVPRILVVVCVPWVRELWVNQSQYELILRRCGYWITLLGHPESANKRSVRVEMPRRQVFDVNALKGLMGRVANGEKP